MTLGAPEWFWGFLAVPLLAAVFLRNETRRQKLLRQLVAVRLLPNLAATVSGARRRTKFALALLGLAGVVAALTQPRWGETVEESHRRGLDVMIAVDTSKSMMSNDVQPDRLSRAKFAAQDLLDALGGNRVGLIAFAGTAFVQAPLTIDDSAVLASITDLDTNTIPRGGTDIASAIRAAADAFGKGESTQRALIIFTDGEDLEEDAVQAARAQKGNFRIFTVGVGTREGSLIPLMDQGGGTAFVKDSDGQFVKSHLDETRLRQIAEATGGFYLHLDNGPQTMNAIIRQGLSKMSETEFEAKETHPVERYEWPLSAGMLLLCVSIFIRERRREPRRGRAPRATAAAAALALLLLLPPHGWSKNAGIDLYDQKDYKGAYDVFQQQLGRNPDSAGLEFDEGTAAYKAGDYDKALESFGKVIGSPDPGLRSQAEYNLGNTLVQRGALQQAKEEKIKEWTEALQHYAQALKTEPDNADVKYNQEAVRKMIEDLKKNPPPQQQQKQDQQNQQKKDDQQKQDQNQQQQQNQSQSKQDQQNQQNQNQQKQQQQQQQQNQQSQNQQSQSQQQNQQAQNQPQPQQQGQQGQNQPPQSQNGHQGQQPPQTAQQTPQNGESGASPSPSPGSDSAGSPSQPQNSGSDQQQQAEARPAGSGSPAPTPQEQKLSGEIKDQPGQQDQQAKEQADAQTAATEPAKPGEMTPSQARALIDSLRGEDEHVSLSGRDHTEEPTFKDW